MSLASTVLLGVVGAIVMYVGARQVLRRRDDARAVSSPSPCSSAFLVAPSSRSSRSARSSPRRWPGSSARARCCARRPRTRIRAARWRSAAIDGRGRVRRRRASPTRRASRCCKASRSAPSRARSRRWSARRGPGKSTIIGLIAAFHAPTRGPRPGGRRRPLDGAARLLPHAARRRAAGDVPVRRHDPRERRVLAARRQRGGDPGGLPHRARRRVRRALSEKATTRSSASAASSSRAASGSASRSRARSWPIRAS